MVKRAVVDKTTGLVQSIIEPSDPLTMPVGDLANTNLIVMDIPPQYKLSTTHYDFVANAWGTHKQSITGFDAWDAVDKKWITNVKAYAEHAYEQLKLKTSNFILIESKFTIFDQIRCVERLSELGFKSLDGTISSQEIEQLLEIKNVQKWRNSIISELQNIKPIILSRLTELEVTKDIDSLQYNSAPKMPF